MLKKIQSILMSMLIIFAAILVPMEPENNTKKLAAKSATRRSQLSSTSSSAKSYGEHGRATEGRQKKSDNSFTESSSEEVPCGEVSSEYSFEENPLAYLFKTTEPFNLADYHNKSGSVLPLYTGPRKGTYVILTREAHGKDKRKYDDFSGGRERKDQHPQIASAREFNEEAILEHTLGWNLQDTIQFLDPKNSSTLDIIAYSKDKNPRRNNSRDVKNVTYIVNFDTYADTLFNNFYDALATEKAKKNRSTTEKDRIAGVLLEDLKKAIINKQEGKPVYVSANVLNPKTRSFQKETVTLRPFLIEKLRPYFLDMQYELGEDKKIKHYTIYRQ